MYVCPYCPHLFYAWGEIQYSESEHNAPEQQTDWWTWTLDKVHSFYFVNTA